MDNNKIQINKFLSYKILYDNQYRKVFKLISEYKESDPIFYNKSMIKLLILLERSSEAKEYVLNLLEINPESKSAYYNSYKINVRENNFIDAFLDLFKFQQLCTLDDIDVTLPLTMLEVYLDMCFSYDYYAENDYTIKNSNIFITRYINVTDIKILYEKLINAFNEKDYKKMKKILSEMNALINTINYPIEVNSLEYIVNAIIKKQKELSKTKTKIKNYL